MQSLSENDRGNLEVGRDAIWKIEIFTQRADCFQALCKFGKDLSLFSRFERSKGVWKRSGESWD
jgi:hypothetical protein